MSSTAPETARPDDRGSGRLLVVDDNEMNRDMLSRRLMRAGFEVVVADDGPGALEQVRLRGVRGEGGEPTPTESPRQAGGESGLDLVLLDVMMPGIDGYEVLRRIREHHSATDLPVIMATAKDQREDIVKALSMGANDYVTKPLDFPVVLARVRTQLELKRSVDRILRLERSLEHRNAELDRANQRMRKELDLAARMQRALLPAHLPVMNEARFAWAYHPCEELAGDILNIFPIGARQVGMYLLDVSGHGVPAALLSVTLSRLMAPSSVAGEGSPVVRRGEGGIDEAVPPAEVAAELNRRFVMDADTLQYFTLFYGVLDVSTTTLRYVCAGHPAPIVLPREGEAAVVAPSHTVAVADGRGGTGEGGWGGFPIGWFPDAVYQEQVVRLGPGDRLFLHSDGISEAMNPARVQFGLAGIRRALEAGRGDPIGAHLDRLLEAAREWSTRFVDDVSAVAVEIVEGG